MKTAPAEMIVRELRADLAELINVAWMRDQVTFVTGWGRCAAAVVTVAVAEQAAGDSPGSGANESADSETASRSLDRCIATCRSAFYWLSRYEFSLSCIPPPPLDRHRGRDGGRDGRGPNLDPCSITKSLSDEIHCGLFDGCLV
jgi:hypothetical protein